MGLTPGDIQALLDLFEASSWQEMTIDIGEDHLHVSRRANGSAPAVTAAPVAVATPIPAASGNAEAAAPPPAAPPPAAPAGVPTGVAVKAPSVGLFWRAPAPGAPPFVDVGSRVGP